MEHDNLSDWPPVIPLPRDLSDEAVVALIASFQDIIDALESYYAAQLIRYYRENDPRQPDLWDDIPDSDPPF